MKASLRGLIFEIQKMSTEDGPGIRTTIFFKQCPLKCVWCHNPESIHKKLQLQWLAAKCIGCKSCIEACKQKALKLDKKSIHINRDKCNGCGECVARCPSNALNMFGKYWDLEDLYKEIEKDNLYYTKSGGGITVSGGEPTLQPDFVHEFLKKCKENGISTALDTCGYASKNAYEKILPNVDLMSKGILPHPIVFHPTLGSAYENFRAPTAEWIVEASEKMADSFMNHFIKWLPKAIEHGKELGEEEDVLSSGFDSLSHQAIVFDEIRLRLDNLLDGRPVSALLEG